MSGLESYASEVKKMRLLQIKYFQTRDQRVLVAAKMQEQKEDELTQDILDAM